MNNNDPRKNVSKRYATAAIVFGVPAVAGGVMLSASHEQTNTGIPFYSNGKQYFVQGDSRRVVYPSREACMKDVPVAKQSECEAVSNYRSGYSGWYGPLYSPRYSTDYRPSPQYTSEAANSTNFGKKFPSSANSSGFGAHGKAFTGSKGS